MTMTMFIISIISFVQFLQLPSRATVGRPPLRSAGRSFMVGLALAFVTFPVALWLGHQPTAPHH